MKFIKTFQVRWSDLDPNWHVANTSYSHFTNDTRVSFLSSIGYAHSEFIEQNLGPVVFYEEFYYLRELYHNEEIRVDVQLLGKTADNRFWRFCHSFFKQDGNMAAYSEVTFGWLDLKTRKLALPPDALLQGLNALEKAEHYAEIAPDEIRSKKIPKRKYA